MAEDRRGNLVGTGDMAAQARQAFANVSRSLTAAGARPEQVAKITISSFTTGRSISLISQKPA